MKRKDYKDAIDDCTEVICRLYDKHKQGLYNKAIKEAFERLKKDYDDEFCNHYWFQRDVYNKLILESLPKWKRIQYALDRRPIIPENSITRDGYYIDLISLDRLPREE